MKIMHPKNEGALNIIIVGCGQIGKNLAEQLNEQGNNITVIDFDPATVKELSTKLDIMGVVGNGATHAVQEEAGIENADLLIAVTGSDELNLLCCLIAKRAGNCRTVARVKNPDYSKESDYLKNELGLAMVINPEYAAALEIARILRFPSALKIDTFAGGRAELVKFQLPESSPLVGTAVRDVAGRFHCNLLFCTIERGEEAHIAKGDFVFEAHDTITLVATPKSTETFFLKIGYKTRPVRGAMIAGGTKTAHYLCELLEKDGVKIKLIERDPVLCREFCEAFPGMTVINGNASDRDTLLEEGLADTDAFVSLTDLDEENILLSLYAKSVTDGKIITKINRCEFDDVVKPLALGSTVYPENLTSDSIVRFARAKKNTRGSNMETLYNIIKGKVEAAEFIAREDSPVIGKPLSTLQIEKNILLAAILRGKEVIIPRGHDEIRPGDRVVVVSQMLPLHDLSDILR